MARLAYYDESLEEFVVEPIEYEFFIGRHSLDEHAIKTRFVVQDD